MSTMPSISSPVTEADLEVNRAELAVILGVSEPTIDAWLREGMPCLEVGSNGRPYRFDPRQCDEWRKARDDVSAASAARRREVIHSLQLELNGGVGGDTEMALTPSERIKFYDAEQKRMGLERDRGNLLERTAVAEVLDTLFGAVAQAFDGLPDQAERAIGLTAKQTAGLAEIVTEIRAELYKTIIDLAQATDEHA